tara:strand:- start:1741 stop:2238 length:498 start_codon:yes stop_codon:yes gene_type:complete
MYVEIDIDASEIASEVISELDLSDEIEDAVRDAINNSLDYDDIRYHIEDDISLSSWDQIEGAVGDVDDMLEASDTFTELQRTVERLVEHLGLPEERTGKEQIQDLIESGKITLVNLETIVANQCDEQRRNMKRMNKTELVYTAQQMGYHVYESMTIAEIHEAVGL